MAYSKEIKEKVIERIQKGESIAEIARDTKISRPAIMLWGRKYEEQNNVKIMKEKREYSVEDKEKVIERIQKGESIAKISADTDISIPTIYEWVRKYEEQNNIKLIREEREYSVEDKEKVIERIQKGESIAKISKDTKISKPTIRRWGRNYEEQNNVKIMKEKREYREYSVEDKEKVIERIQKGESIAEIAKDTEIPISTIRTWVRKYEEQKKEKVEKVKNTNAVETPTVSIEQKQERVEEVKNTKEVEAPTVLIEQKQERVEEVKNTNAVETPTVSIEQKQERVEEVKNTNAVETPNVSIEQKKEKVEKVKNAKEVEAPNVSIEQKQESTEEVKNAKEVKKTTVIKEQQVEKKERKTDKNKYYLAGIKEYKVGRLKNAIQYLEKSLEQEENYTTLFILGKCYAGIKERGKAGQLFIRVIELDEGNIPARIELARLCVGKGLEQEKRAEQLYKEAIELDKKNKIQEQSIVAKMDLGKLYAKQGKSVQAGQMYREAEELNIQNNIIKKGLIDEEQQKRLFNERKVKKIYENLPEEIMKAIGEIQEKYYKEKNNINNSDKYIKKYTKKYNNLQRLLESGNSKRGKAQIMLIMINEGYEQLVKNYYPREHEFIIGLIQEYNAKKLDSKTLKEKLDEFCM